MGLFSNHIGSPHVMGTRIWGENEMVSGMTCAGENYSAAPGETQPSSLSQKPCNLPNPESGLGQMKCPCIFFFGWQYFNLDPVFHQVAS